LAAGFHRDSPILKRVNMRGFLVSIITVVLPLLCGGCASSPPVNTAMNISGGALVWPKAPAEARIGYVRSVSGPRDMGIAKPFFRGLLDKLAGRGPEHFVRPTGVAMQDGVLYVADPGAQALWILDSLRSRYVKVVLAGDAAFVSPVAVALRADGAVFVADTGLKKVFLFGRDGAFIRIAAETGLVRPAGLAYDTARDWLYVVDSAQHRIAIYGPQGNAIRTLGNGGNQNGQFNFPTHLALDGAGTLRVTDALNFRLQSFDRDDHFVGKFGHAGDGSGDFAAPKGVATDSAGNIYLVDALFDTVQIFDGDGTYLLAFGEQGTQAGQFWLPGGIFIDRNDEIYVTDGYNKRVQVFRVMRGAIQEKAR
jgi:DNA-binding beta-propeller fold protein YncE